MPNLVAPHILALQAYEPGKPEDELRRELGLSDVTKLASNENPHGASPKVLEALANQSWLFHRYPDARAHDLRTALAEHHGVPAEHIALGAGSSELIDLLCRVCASRGAHVVFGDPSFSMYRICSIAQELEHSGVPLRNDLRWSVDDLLNAVRPNTRLLFVANPNNPTGDYMARDQLERLLTEVPPDTLVVLDEAYVEYANAPDFRPATDFRALRERLAILRTFSKAYGLAALRVGYLIGQPELVFDLNRLRFPYNVSTIGQRAAEIALSDQAHVKTSVSECIEQRAMLAASLEAQGLVVAPSQANFVLVKTPEPGRAVFEALLHEGVIVRPMHATLESWIRVTVGLPEQNARFLDALQRVLKDSRG